MKNLTQMHNMTNLPGRLVLGGDQQSLIQLDVETQKELRIVRLLSLCFLNLHLFAEFLQGN